MTRFILAASASFPHLFAPFPKLAHKLLKQLLRLWSSAAEHVRIDAFLRIRDLCLHVPASEPFLDNALKHTYLTYVRHAKFTSPRTLPVITFMSNCVVELYSIDPVCAYQHAFVYIRQLAVHLRNATLAKTKEAYKSVYNWQYINCLRVWANVLARGTASPTAGSGRGDVDNSTSTSSGRGGDTESSAARTQQMLRPLLYPFVQVCMGVLQLMPVSSYYPLHFVVIRLLNQVCLDTALYVPVASHLLAVLQCAELNRKPTASTARPVDIHYTLHVSTAVLSTKSYQAAMVDEALSLLLEHFVVFAYSVSFPELVTPAVLVLRRFAKQTKIHQARKKVQQLVDRLLLNSDFIATQRAAVAYAPKDVPQQGVSGLVTFQQAIVTAAGGDGSGKDGQPPASKKQRRQRAAAVTAPLVQYLELSKAAAVDTVTAASLRQKAAWTDLDAEGYARPADKSSKSGVMNDNDKGDEKKKTEEMSKTAKVKAKRAAAAQAEAAAKAAQLPSADIADSDLEEDDVADGFSLSASDDDDDDNDDDDDESDEE